MSDPCVFSLTRRIDELQRQVDELVGTVEVLKLRRKRGPVSKLTEKDVLDIRNEYASTRVTKSELAVRYEVSSPTISSALDGSTWRHVGGPLFERRRHGK